MLIDLDGLWINDDQRTCDQRTSDDQRTTGDSSCMVPGPMGDPTRSAPRTLRRKVELPAGNWSRAWLELDGARWRPRVAVNGETVACTDGGLAPIVLPLQHAAVRPGAQIELAVQLCALDEVPIDDASRLPDADRWRANCASNLWDSVRVRLTGPERIVRLAPCVERTAAGWTVHVLAEATGTLHLRVRDGDAVLAEGAAPLLLPPTVQPWPHLLTLEAELHCDGVLSDRRMIPLSLRTVCLRGNGLQLNGAPLQLRMISVVWHRWCRDSALAWDAAWFQREVIARVQRLGGNGIRFHLGLPPRRILELCDRAGLLVQAEWSCFHGLPASEDSLAAQWSDWLDRCAEHPSVVVVHGWNESEGPDLAKAHRAMTRALAGRVIQPIVAHRDVVHLHRYWWSLFENLGLYYDHAGQFDCPVIADEFGGNYLDADGAPGAYPTVASALQRFLGWQHTREERLGFQAMSNARMAEYWRSLDVAGFSPFCALGSSADGNHWFLGDLAEGRPKPVWAALGAALHPTTAMLRLWQTTCTPGAAIACALSVRNDTPEPTILRVAVGLRVADGAVGERHELDLRLPPYGRAELEVPVTIAESGVVEAEIVGTPARSSWPIRTHRLVVDPRLRSAKVHTSDEEVRRFLQELDIPLVDAAAATVCVGSGEALSAAIARGMGAVWLQAGERFLGAEYATKPHSLTPASEQPPGHLETAWGEWSEAAGSVRVRFRQVVEPESCLHPPREGSPLWNHLPGDAHRLWNGLRGGLIVPAVDWQLSGLSQEAARSAWLSRGAPPELLASGSCIAYGLAGIWAFSATRDPAVESRLRAQVRFLAEDAPALAWATNPQAAIEVSDVAADIASSNGMAQRLDPLAVAGKNLARTPVWRVAFGSGRGHLCLSQCLTAGRLHESCVGVGFWGVRTDPCAQQLVLDLMALALAD